MERHCAIGREESVAVAASCRSTVQSTRNPVEPVGSAARSGDFQGVVQTDCRDRRAKLPLPSRRPVHSRHNGHSCLPVRRSAAWYDTEPTSPRQPQHLTAPVRGGAAPQDVPSHRLSVGPSLQPGLCSYPRSLLLRSLLCSALLRSSFWRGEGETASSPSHDPIQVITSASTKTSLEQAQASSDQAEAEHDQEAANAFQECLVTRSS